MATITATPHDAPAVGARARQRMRAAWNRAVDQAGAMVSAARLRSSPALTIGGFITIDTSAFQLAAGHVSPGIGLLVTGLSMWAYDWSRD